MDDDLVNNRLCNGNAVEEGGIPAVAFGCALLSVLAAGLVPATLRAAFVLWLEAEVSALGAATTVEGACSVLCAGGDTEWPEAEANGLEDENWMPL
ncbi:hypothetical protein FKP32DRAFT_1426207 [Trametes sanguinea]|nr:hypothetical protein FKP32DRAFT_1426207 [Trametes sanguinea]